MSDRLRGNFCGRRLGSTDFSLWIFCHGAGKKSHRLKSVLLEPTPRAPFISQTGTRFYYFYALRNSLHLHGGAVGQHFRDALHDFRGVVAHRDDGVGAVFGGVLHH